MLQYRKYVNPDRAAPGPRMLAEGRCAHRCTHRKVINHEPIRSAEGIRGVASAGGFHGGGVPGADRFAGFRCPSRPDRARLRVFRRPVCHRGRPPRRHPPLHHRQGDRRAVEGTGGDPQPPDQRHRFQPRRQLHVRCPGRRPGARRVPDGPPRRQRHPAGSRCPHRPARRDRRRGRLRHVPPRRLVPDRREHQQRRRSSRPRRRRGVHHHRRGHEHRHQRVRITCRLQLRRLRAEPRRRQDLRAQLPGRPSAADQPQHRCPYQRRAGPGRPADHRVLLLRLRWPHVDVRRAGIHGAGHPVPG